jgi:hypothetical protein
MYLTMGRNVIFLQAALLYMDYPYIIILAGITS